MSRRNKIIIISVIVALVILGIVLIVLAPGNKEPATNINAVNAPINGAPVTTVSGINTSANISVQPPLVTQEPATQTSIIAFAMTFAERLGSFSSESNYENINNLRPSMTNNMINWSNQYIAEHKLDSEIFYGITTKALNATIISLDETETSGQVLVTTQRSEKKGNVAAPQIIYQKILLDLAKEGKEWKVNKATWQ